MKSNQETMSKPKDNDTTTMSGVESPSDLLAPFPMIQRHLMFIENASRRGDMEQVSISRDEIQDAVLKIYQWCRAVNEHLADDPHPSEGGSVDSFSLRAQYDDLHLPR